MYILLKLFPHQIWWTINKLSAQVSAFIGALFWIRIAAAILLLEVIQSRPKHCQSWGEKTNQPAFSSIDLTLLTSMKRSPEIWKTHRFQWHQQSSSPGNAGACQDLGLGYSAVKVFCSHFSRKPAHPHTGTSSMPQHWGFSLQLELCIS